MNPLRRTNPNPSPAAVAVLLVIATMPRFAQAIVPATAANQSQTAAQGTSTKSGGAKAASKNATAQSNASTNHQSANQENNSPNSGSNNPGIAPAGWVPQNSQGQAGAQRAAAPASTGQKKAASAPPHSKPTNPASSTAPKNEF
ncbi:MAG: hypothetical protein WAM04_02355 [Candidatus Sulfotelmatobacter sp.]